jgi:hypothetical protein
MPTIAFIGAAVAKMLRHPLVREALVAILAAGANYIIRRLKRRPTAS